MSTTETPYVECNIGLDPNDSDGDGDGTNDGAEVAQGRNPLVNELAALVPIGTLNRSCPRNQLDLLGPRRHGGRGRLAARRLCTARWSVGTPARRALRSVLAQRRRSARDRHRTCLHRRPG